MRILIGQYSDKGRFPTEPPIDEAKLVEWVELHSGGTTFGVDGSPATRNPDVPVRCRAWAVEVETLDDLFAQMDLWRHNYAASWEMELRDRGRDRMTTDVLVTFFDCEDEHQIAPTILEYLDPVP